ncbi:MAG TPA: hypothetical protein VNK81_01435, partial [Thermodesulfobacteriota bacterium]|nr:hypothetical protein [Thermodesulfobacteriota bacterium]
KVAKRCPYKEISSLPEKSSTEASGELVTGEHDLIRFYLHDLEVLFHLKPLLKTRRTTACGRYSGYNRSIYT